MSDYEYKFFDDEDIEDFIKNTFPQYYKFFSEFPHKIQKIDFFRYLAVYHFGGFYLDCDVLISKSLDEICENENIQAVFPKEINNNTDELLKRQNVSLLVGQYAFGSIPQHEFLRKIIDNMVYKRIASHDIPKFHDKLILYSTGPVMVTQSWIDYEKLQKMRKKKKSPVTLLETNPFQPDRFGDYGSHSKAGIWRNPTRHNAS